MAETLKLMEQRPGKTEPSPQAQEVIQIHVLLRPQFETAKERRNAGNVLRISKHFNEEGGYVVPVQYTAEELRALRTLPDEPGGRAYKMRANRQQHAGLYR